MDINGWDGGGIISPLFSMDVFLLLVKKVRNDCWLFRFCHAELLVLREALPVLVVTITSSFTTTGGWHWWGGVTLVVVADKILIVRTCFPPVETKDEVANERFAVVHSRFTIVWYSLLDNLFASCMKL